MIPRPPSHKALAGPRYPRLAPVAAYPDCPTRPLPRPDGLTACRCPECGDGWMVRGVACKGRVEVVAVCERCKNIQES